MAILDDKTRGYLVGAAAALTAAAIVREFRSEFGELGRPLAKAVIKSGLALSDKMREVAAHMGEVVEDLAIEARYELDARQNGEIAQGREAPKEENASREVH